MVVTSFCSKFLGLLQSNDICKNLYWKMASAVVYIFLPLAGLTIVWKRNEIFAKFWTNVEQYYLPVAFHSFGRRKLLLNWAKQRLPPNWSSYMKTLSGGIADFWNDGSLLCALINTAVPGACPNPYRHWQKTPDHAQEVAYKYLGIFQIFSESDFTSSLTPYLENKLVNYLTQIQKSISILEKDKLFYSLISTRYVVRGMGLYTAEQFKESEFFIYSNIPNSSFYNLEILILGPYSTFCRTTVLECLLKDSKKLVSDPKTKNSWLKAKECYFDKLRDLNDSENSSEDSCIEIKVTIECDRVKVSYTSTNYGIHEVNLSCNKEVIMGSPFYINILKTSSEENNETKDHLMTNNDTNRYTFKNINHQKNVDATKENEMLLNPAKKSSKENNEKDVIVKTYVPEKDDTGIKYNKCIDKIQNNINKVRNETDNELPRVNNFDFKKESTLEISKFLKDLNTRPKKRINVDIPNYPDPLNDLKDRNCSFYFSKENYSGFQKAVDCSFRRSCRITRKLPKLVQETYPVVSGASPVCSDHSVPEDLGKLSVEEKRKKFLIQKSLATPCDEKLTNSSSSINENRKESPRNNNKHKNVDEGSSVNGKTSGSTKINTNDFNKCINTSPISRNEHTRLYRIVKQKKLFWETVFQNSDNIFTEQNISKQSDTSSTLLKKVTSQAKNYEDESLSSYKKDGDNKNRKSEKLAPSYGLKHVDSLCLLKQRTFSKSSYELRYSERKRSLVTYKSLDENLDQCCKVSLDNRTKIYLDHISSFQSKSKEKFGHPISFKMNIPKEGLKLKWRDDALELSNSTQYIVSLNNDLATRKTKEKELKKMSFKTTIDYFKNLEPVAKKTFIKQIKPITSTENIIIIRDKRFSNKDLDGNLNVNNWCETFKNKNTINDNNTCSNTKISGINNIATYPRRKIFKLGCDQDKIKHEETDNPRYIKCKRRKSVSSLFDILY